MVVLFLCSFKGHDGNGALKVRDEQVVNIMHLRDVEVLIKYLIMMKCREGSYYKSLITMQKII